MKTTIKLVVTGIAFLIMWATLYVLFMFMLDTAAAIINIKTNTLDVLTSIALSFCLATLPSTQYIKHIVETS